MTRQADGAKYSTEHFSRILSAQWRAGALQQPTGAGRLQVSCVVDAWGEESIAGQF